MRPRASWVRCTHGYAKCSHQERTRGLNVARKPGCGFCCLVLATLLAGRPHAEASAATAPRPVSREPHDVVGGFSPEALRRTRQAMDDGRGGWSCAAGKFRWESTPAGAEPGAQVLIADGLNLWFIDRDLQQATVRPLSEALPQSPAMLLAGGADLRAAFDLRADGRRDGLDWVRVLPRDSRSDFREASFGFQGEQLLRMMVVDKLGQRSTLVFTRVERNKPVGRPARDFHPAEGRRPDRQADRALKPALARQPALSAALVCGGSADRGDHRGPESCARQNLPEIGLSDKIEHTLAYVVLAFWLASVVIRRTISASSSRCWCSGLRSSCCRNQWDSVGAASGSTWWQTQRALSSACCSP